MRIGFDAKRAFFNRTGLGVYSRDVINEALSAPEIESIYLYTPPVKKAPFAEFVSGNSKACLREPSGPLSKLVPSLWRSFSLSGEAANDRINVFHGLSFELPVGIEKVGVRTVVNIHDLIFLKYPRLYKLIDRTVYEYKTRSSSKKSDAVITISRKTKEDLCYYTGIKPEKVHVIYPSFSERFKAQISRQAIDNVMAKYSINKPYFLFVSSITERKNLMTLVRALAIIRDKTEAVLVVSGKGKGLYPSLINKTIAELKLENRVVFIGHADDADLPVLYKGAVAFVYPSFYEGFGLPILEAVASGIPVLAATGSCLEEAGGNGALYSDPGNEGEMAEKLYAILSDGVLRDKLVSAGQKQLPLFTSDNSRASLIKLYRSLL
ncbi:MAG: glycosyltransferase family 4 protein [Fibrobacteres bacterium]|nr:glycosyltransferase family 4 protein [Fibrobacterota bacterium]